jgi:hypothetical protein
MGRATTCERVEAAVVMFGTTVNGTQQPIIIGMTIDDSRFESSGSSALGSI